MRGYYPRAKRLEKDVCEGSARGGVGRRAWAGGWSGGVERGGVVDDGRMR